jgi:hypothetical protein
MDRFRTPIELVNPRFYINHSHQIYSIGSCFAGCMGRRFNQNKFKSLSNPFGVIFNPLSLFKLLEADSSTNWKDGLLKNKELWYHYDLHSEVTAESETAMLQLIQERVNESRRVLDNADVLIITFGTALVYRHKSTGETVANCHKMPGSLFDKLLLSPEEIMDSATSYLDAFFQKRPDARVILTVSPVRHIKDTLPMNAVSKSVLRYAAHCIESKYDKVHYFPSYEIMNDELRDYRFYKSDMIHPSEVAEEYIWERFSEVYFESTTLELLEKWGKLHRAINHKPFQPRSEAHQQFIRSTIAKLEALQQQLDVSGEIAYLKSQLPV